ncbi:MAG: imidazoleglycerol-phosphate dehydratase HisB [Gaiellaceae bacterium]
MTEARAAQITLGRPGESSGENSIATGVAVLDHLLLALAEAGRFGLRLEIAPGEPEAEVDAAGATLGAAVRPLLGQRGVGIAAADEALAMVVLEVSGKPLVASNADLTSTKAGGLRTDLAAAFLRGLAEEAGLTIHVRLFEGQDSQHVLEAIFKALGAALADARQT